MYYQEPEMEIILFEQDIFTEDQVSSSQTGNDWDDNFNPYDSNSIGI